MNLLEILTVGVVATAASDIWQQAQKPLTGIPAANWSVTGRWVIGWRDGRIYDPMIGKRPILKGEAVVGWAFHYLIGAVYAALYLSFVVVIAKTVPTLLNGLLFGLVTLLAPFLFMKPALGGGFFGLRAPNPEKGLFLSISAHAVFGIGLYLGELFYQSLF
ncbi:DUF2938 family protein [Gluconobacter japonicus]|uniref:DUF2938 family protein n=1 Tax=Gluconobacter japonicus TaxID=376620 RepID=A0A9Q2IS85_GLUJA|nr:DUF2938 family protein [Gluconobacter japonicus]MBF0871530.1 DUF2938 family protein [Gluconobacter japonicus]